MSRQTASVRTPILVAVCFLLGLAASAVWFHRPVGRAGADAAGADAASGLTETTRGVLGGLTAPVEIRLYAVLDPSSAPENLRAFAGRVDRFLALYQTEANSRLTVTRVAADVAPRTAAKDGITAFNQDQGDACYLGLVVVCGDRKETLSRLSPDWEPALESDLTRAIQHVTTRTTEAAVVAAAATQPDAVAVASLKQQLPDVATLTLEDGSQRLREVALEKFKAAVAEMQTELEQAQQKLADARRQGSVSEQEAAAKTLQQVQTAQAEKLKQITADFQAQLDVLQRIKQP
ncbi:MAG TPA: Gldg family protein [Verrucomicrobiae bacterium]|nr:Gldg family protein [Verrucomicrobiae bacterium]